MSIAQNKSRLLISALVAAAGFAASSTRGESRRATGGASESAIYSPVGKRDPFKPPALTPNNRDIQAINPLEKFAVEQFQLRAVLRGVGKARAMFEDPEGKTHILAEGDTIGRERATVSRILNNEVIVTERTFNYLGVESLYEKILSLPPEKDSGVVDSTRPGGGGRR